MSEEMIEIKAFPIRIHDKAKLTCIEHDDRLLLKLVNKVTGKAVEKPYFKLDTGVDLHEAMKIDVIVYHMHNEIGLNVWESN